MGLEILFADLLIRVQDHRRANLFAPFCVRQADDRDFGHARVAGQRVFLKAPVKKLPAVALNLNKTPL